MIIKKIQGRINQILDNRPSVQAKYKEQRDKMLNKAFLSSKAYDQLMTSYYNKEEAGNEAELKNENFLHRHMNYLKILGCWRWMGLYEYKDKIMSTVYQGKGIDFGGAAGPVTKDSTIVDFSTEDIFKRPVHIRSLTDIDFKADYIFTSHTLEHIPDLDVIFNQMNDVIKRDGQLIIHLPAYSCVRWRNGLHTNRKFNDHAWTFYLSNDEEEVKNLNLPNTMAIDTKVSKYFNIQNANYCGDNSIMIFAKPKM